MGGTRIWIWRGVLGPWAAFACIAYVMICAIWAQGFSSERSTSQSRPKDVVRTRQTEVERLLLAYRCGVK